MRLSFPNGEHADLTIDSGVVSLGSAADNSIVLPPSLLRPHQARLSVDNRGMLLEVLDATARTHVNARPVREKALLRLGDVVNLDTVSIVLKSDRDDVIRTHLPQPVEPSGAPARSVVLRGVSGAQFGKAISIGEHLVIGTGAASDLILDEPQMAERHAIFEVAGDAIHLRGIGGRVGTTVNGIAVTDAVLHPGDQISFGRNRFVLEAPGFPLRGAAPPTPVPSITQFMSVMPLPDEGDTAEAEASGSPRSGNGWLIAAAAVIGLGIAALLWLGSR